MGLPLSGNAEVAASCGFVEIRTKALKPGIVAFRVDLTADQLTGGAVTQEVPTTIYKDLP